jgi:ATP-dependent Lon protease
LRFNRHHTCLQGTKAALLKLLSFQLPLSVSRANVLLLGPPGAGKSSLVSTLDSLIRGNLTRRADYGGATTSLTTALQRYTFAEGAGYCEYYQ